MTDLQPLWNWFRWLYESHGIKLTIFYDAFDRARFFEGFLTSLQLMALCIVASVVIGVVGAWIQGSRSRFCAALMQGYIQFFRNTPPLVQLYFFYFALGSYLRMTGPTGIEVPLVTNFSWAVICLSLYAGAFNVEIFRAGIEAVPRTPSRRPKRSATSGSAPISTSSCRSPSASACRRSTTTSSTSSRRRPSPTRSPCRRCSTSATRSGRTSSTLRR